MALAIASCYQKIGLGPRPSSMSDTARSDASGALHNTGNHARHRNGHKQAPHTRKELLALSLGALGVVYGDIGTSPLYAMRECLNATGEHAVRGSSTANVFGVVSLFFWSLTLIVCLKYLVLVLRADNKGEGGILALAALLRQGGVAGRRRRAVPGLPALV